MTTEELQEENNFLRHDLKSCQDRYYSMMTKVDLELRSWEARYNALMKLLIEKRSLETPPIIIELPRDR